MFQQLKVDKLIVREYSNRTAMSEDAAFTVSEKIKEILDKQPFVNIVFASAPSQDEFLRALRIKELDWGRINAFHMDEYIGLNNEASEGFGNFLKRIIFDKVPFLSIQYLDGAAVDVREECSRYRNLLLKYPFDIVCMGIGENGHIAFNDPHEAKFDDPSLIKIVKLDATSRQQQVNDGCFSEISKVPTHALTLTIPALFSATYIYCIVPGKTKASIVYETLTQVVAEICPSTIIRNHCNAFLYLDNLSSAQIKDLMKNQDNQEYCVT